MFIENLDEIKSRLDPEQVLDFIQPGKKKNRRGNELRTPCPVHEGDGAENFAINLSTHEWFCHSQQCKGSNLIDLYAQSRKITFPEAASELANQFSIKIDYRKSRESSSENYTPEDVLRCLEEAKTQGNDIYFKRKGLIPPPIVRYGKNPFGYNSMLIPLRDVEEDFKGFICLQENEKYKKRNYKYKEIIGAFALLGEINPDGEFYAGEGIATVQTAWEATQRKIPAICCGGWHNIMPVVVAIKSKYPNSKPIILIDCDEGGNGMKAALMVAQTFPDATFRNPSFESFPNPRKEKLTDFNDIISKCNQSLDEVQRQLQIEYTLLDQVENKGEVTKNSTSLLSSSLLGEIELDVIKYLINARFEDVIASGFDHEDFQSSIFSGSSVKQGREWISINRLVMEAIRKTWELGKPTTLSEVALNCGNYANNAYEILRRLETRQQITASQVRERINKLRQDTAWVVLESAFLEAKKNNLPIHESARKLRQSIDGIQGRSESVLSQSYYLHTHIEEIKNPANKPIETGIKSFDRLTGGGFKKTEVGCLTGGAGAGKSAFALQIADSLASKDVYVLYFSIEIGARKLFERSLKRLSYAKTCSKNKHTKDEKIDLAVEKYRVFAENISLIKGYNGMLVSEIRGKALSVMQRTKQDIVLIIDPFQRLGTGDERIDGNPTVKAGYLIAEIKQMAEDLEIPILVLSDTVKGHKDNATGEGAARDSYMIDHTVDYNMMLRTSKDALKALYGDIEPKPVDDPFIEKVKNVIAQITKKKEYELTGSWDKYASLVTPKVRDSGKFNPLFIYRPAYHLFEDIPIWDVILPKEDGAW